MNHKKNNQSPRRELAVRDHSYAQKSAKWLSQKNITPNQISLLSVFFAIVGFGTLYNISENSSPLLFIGAALCIQLRLLCNLFDGMVAVEGGKKTAAGELFNDAPDRVADPLFIIGAGYLTASEFGVTLGWLCALLAVMTAYIRVLGSSMGVPADFQGPMAKQHRMALLTIALVFLFIVKVTSWFPAVFDFTMDAVLFVMMCGLILTCWNRITNIYTVTSALNEEDK